MLLPLLLWAFLRPTRQMVSVRLWIAAGAVMAIGNLLLLQWDTLTFAGKDILIRLIFVSYLVLRISSFRLDLGQPLRAPTILMGYLVYVAMHEVVRAWFPQPVGLLVMTSAVTTLLTLILALLAWQVSRVEGIRSARWLAGGLAVYTLLFALRVIALLTGQTPLDQLAASPVANAIGLAVVLIPLIEHMGYLGICIERSQRAERAALADLSEQTGLSSLHQQIAVLDRRRSLGEMAAVLGHELKQPLTSVLTSAQVVQMALKGEGRLDESELNRLLDRIADGARRANLLVERIGSFVKPSKLERRPVDLNEVVREALALSQSRVQAEGVVASVAYWPHALWVTGDPLQLSQVVLNLLINAIEATNGQTNRLLGVGCLQDGQNGVVHVQDNGAGYATKDLSRLGTPFYTTKTDGMGMGLAVSLAIAQQHNGNLNFRNIADGARAEMVLPLSDSVMSQGAVK